jgi:hypothetical protein
MMGFQRDQDRDPIGWTLVRQVSSLTHHVLTTKGPSEVVAESSPSRVEKQGERE